MDLPGAVTMDEEAARAALEEYRALGKRTTEEDEAIIACARELARGHQLIRATLAIAQAGHDDVGRPNVVIACADEPEIFVHRPYRWNAHHVAVPGTGDLLIRASKWSRSKARRLDVAADELEGWPPLERPWYATVPSVPARFRPRGALSRYHILWEPGEGWSARSNLPRPPGDPALLRHIRGDVYAVLAMWDLTPLERLVIGL